MKTIFRKYLREGLRFSYLLKNGWIKLRKKETKVSNYFKNIKVVLNEDRIFKRYRHAEIII